MTFFLADIKPFTIVIKVIRAILCEKYLSSLKITIIFQSLKIPDKKIIISEAVLCQEGWKWLSGGGGDGFRDREGVIPAPGVLEGRGVDPCTLHPRSQNCPFLTTDNI